MSPKKPTAEPVAPAAQRKLFEKPIYVGKSIVPRPLTFYVGLSKKHSDTERLIRLHGGHLAPDPGPESSNIIALVDPLAKARSNARTAYSVHFVTECIKHRRMLDLEPFRILPPRNLSKPADEKGQNQTYTNAGTPAILADVRGKEKPVGLDERQSEKDGVPEPAGTRNVGEDVAVVAYNAKDTKGADSSSSTDSHPNLSSKVPSQPITQGPQMTQAPLTQQPTPPSPQHVKTQSPNSVPSNKLMTQTALPPPKEWAPWEDDILRDFRDDADAIRPTALQDVNIWRRIKDVLPKNRTPEECMTRCAYLYARQPSKTAKTCDSQAESERGNSADTEPRVMAPSGSKSQSKSEPDASLHKISPHKRSSGRARVAALKIVSNLAKRAGVSRRRAFRALRKEHGHMERALKTIFAKK